MALTGAKAALARAGLLWAAAALALPAEAAGLRVGSEQRQAAASLLQVKSERRGASKTVKGSQAPASFFGDFHEGESTYDINAAERRPTGWDAVPDNANAKLGGVKTAVFYHESHSGGPKQAFQTHYPALSDAPGARAPTGEWTVDGAGHWQQEYLPTNLASKGPHQQKDAEWFDSGVGQYDGLGRPKSPDEVTALTEVFQARTKNTTLTCKESGCTATATLQAFNGAIEKAENCTLSLHVHPTDFDDQYSGERLTFITVNGVTATNDCFPAVSGCNASTQRAMFSCLQDMSLDNIIKPDGSLVISAKISDVVDECPYEGNLLSSVPVVTCLVAPIVSPPLTVPKPVAPPVQPVVPGIAPEKPTPYINKTVPIRCPERGCTATALVEIGATIKPIKSCLLDVTIYQTDFDASDGTKETIEWVKMDGNTTLAENVIPGGNPCRDMWKDGTKRTETETQYQLIQGQDVTKNALVGLIEVTAKISDHVDECAHNGYLLNGFVTVNCTL